VLAVSPVRDRMESEIGAVFIMRAALTAPWEGVVVSGKAPALSRRRFLRLAGLSAATLASASLASCAPPPAATAPAAQGGPTKTPGEKAQLVYQDWQTEWFPPMAQSMLEEFHATHPNIRVYYTLDPDNLADKMLSDFQSGTAPDVFDGCCDFFPIWGQGGYTLDLRPYVAADLEQATIDDWDPVQYRALFTRDGRQFGLPKYHGALALFFNKDIFDEVRLPYPDEHWTHEDYSQAMRRLTLDRNADDQTDVWGSMFDISWERIQVHVNAWGGHFVDPEDPTRSRMAEPPALAAMEWLRARTWDDRVMPSPLDVQKRGTRQAFVDRQLAMVEDGSWALRDILKDANFRIGVAPFPAGPARRATLATTDGFGIFAGTKYPDAAWELLKFLISKNYGLAMIQAHFLQPARLSLVDDWIATVRDEYPTKTNGMDLAAFADGQRKGYSVVAEIFAHQDAAKRIAYDAWDQIYTLGQAPVELMRTASQEIDKAQS
jgi:multiple sugar transport system substrate-binding protein